MPCDSVAIAPRGLREFLTAALIRLAIRSAVKPALSAKLPIATQRRRMKRAARLLPSPRWAQFEPDVLGGVSGEWVRARGANAEGTANAAILYLHGGGYCVGSPATGTYSTASGGGARSLMVMPK